MSSKIFRLFVYSNFNIILAALGMVIGLYRLPGGHTKIDTISVTQFLLSIWIIYIFDRILDNLREKPNSEHHLFHAENQYNMQILGIALLLINAFLCLFQKLEILVFGALLSSFVVFYLYVVVKNYPNIKNIIMPFIFTIGTLGPIWISASSITLSMWILAGMTASIIFQNVLVFNYFEVHFFGNVSQKTKVEYKIIVRLSAALIFIFLVFFSSNRAYPNFVAAIITVIGLLHSISVLKPEYFVHNQRYRYYIDFYLFLFFLLLFYP